MMLYMGMKFYNPALTMGEGLALIRLLRWKSIFQLNLIKVPFADNITLIANALARMINSSKRLSVETEYNLVDAAIAVPLDDADVLNDILGIGVIDGIQVASIGMPIRKYGRTTDLTEDAVSVIHATVDVSYGTGKTARFEDQIIAGAMSAGGDSGSLVVHRDQPDAVGLLFAGSDSVTIFSPIEYVLDVLELSF